MFLLGTILNTAGILLGGILGLTLRQPKPQTQIAIKNILGVLIVFVGLSATWLGLGGEGFGKFFKFLLIAILSMTLGRLTGRSLGLQKGLNRLGRFAAKKLADAGTGGPVRWSDGFIACAILFCLPPMAIFGAVLDGLDSRWQTLGVKAVMDCLATMAFVRAFGWSSMVAAVPVAAFLGSITLASRLLGTQHLTSAMIDAVNATAGLLVFCVSLIVLEFRKVELADYLPSLAWAPLLAWVWR